MILLALLLASLACSAPIAPWRIYALHDDSVIPLVASPPDRQVALSDGACRRVTSSPLPPVPPAWRVTSSTLADVTGDGLAEWVLIVWRPWRDWPIQDWSPAPSPIAGFHDAAGDSCHLILLDARDGRQVWAGSALPAPLLAAAVGDLDGDGQNELAALEGDYHTGRDGPATRVDVWKWNSFGFTLERQSPPAILHQLCLTDANGDSILVAVR